MRFALCISGFMRGFRQSIRTLRHSFLESLPCDVFISTWDVVGHSQYKFSSGREPEERLTPEMLRAVYGAKLKGYSIRPYDPDSVTPGWMQETPNPHHQRVASMYYHIMEANRLKREAGQYDVTIRCRPDLFFETRLHNAFLGTAYESRKVFTPEIESYNLVNDQFMYGHSEPMDMIASLYGHLAVPQSFYCVAPAEKTLSDFANLQGIEMIKVGIKYKRGS